MHLVGINKENDLVELIEIEDHPYFMGCQFHPEFQSSPMQAHPLFNGLIRATIDRIEKIGDLSSERAGVP